MKQWPFGIFERLRLPESGEPAGGDKGGDPTPKTTVTINGKEISPDIAASALNLYNSLQDPEVGKEIVGTLAQRMGLLKADGEPRKGAEEKVQGKIEKMLRAKFGDKGKEFVDLAGPAIDEAIAEYFNEFKSGIESTSSGNSWDDAVDEFAGRHFGGEVPDDIQTAIQDVIKDMGGVPKGLKGKAAQKYLDRMLKLAVEEGEIELPEPKTRSRSKNRRAAEDDNDLADFREVAAPKGVPSLDQIVDDAMAGRRYKR